VAAGSHVERTHAAKAFGRRREDVWVVASGDRSFSSPDKKKFD